MWVEEPPPPRKFRGPVCEVAVDLGWGSQRGLAGGRGVMLWESWACSEGIKQQGDEHEQREEKKGQRKEPLSTPRCQMLGEQSETSLKERTVSRAKN